MSFDKQLEWSKMLTSCVERGCEPQYYHVSDVEKQGKRDSCFDSLQKPDLNTMHILPGSDGGQSREGYDTDYSVDFNTGIVRPKLM